MATSQATVDYLVDQMGLGVSAKKMFGEYGLYLNGVIFALVCDGSLFVKQTDAGRAFIGSVEEAPPYPGAKNAFLISGERWDDADWLGELTRITVAALPMALPKKAAPKGAAAKKAAPKAGAQKKTSPKKPDLKTAVPKKVGATKVGAKKAGATKATASKTPAPKATASGTRASKPASAAKASKASKVGAAKGKRKA